MKAQFFGPAGSQLLGVYHSPRPVDGIAKSVLVCPPIGHEYLRSHWALKLLANQLSRKGYHVLRFDLRGLGDSHGNPQDVTSIEQWLDDLDLAVEHLKESSNTDSVMVLGLRMGAALAAESASRRDDIHSVVLWEPVLSGNEYLSQLRQMHRLMTDLWYGHVETVDDDSFEEILGTLYRRELLNEMNQWHVNLEDLERPQLIVHHEETTLDLPPHWQKRIAHSDDDSWGKLSELEVAWLRPKTSNVISQSVGEMFERLEEREMLSVRCDGVEILA